MGASRFAGSGVRGLGIRVVRGNEALDGHPQPLITTAHQTREPPERANREPANGYAVSKWPFPLPGP
jgi:hypothetical protein